MFTIPKAVQDTIEKDGFLHFGLSNGVLNLSKTARFIRPLVASRTKKEVSISAITMALSRLRLGKRQVNTKLKTVKLQSINAVKDLSELTYDKTAANMRALEKVERDMRGKGAFMVATFGTTELTIIVEEESTVVVQKLFSVPAKKSIAGLVALGVQFDEKYVPQIGMFYTLIQQLTFQNINIVELTSTYTELVFYLHKKDLKLAFDTLYDQFM